MPLGRKKFQLLKKDIPVGKVEIYLENSMMGGLAVAEPPSLRTSDQG